MKKEHTSGHNVKKFRINNACESGGFALNHNVKISLQCAEEHAQVSYYRAYGRSWRWCRMAVVIFSHKSNKSYAKQLLCSLILVFGLIILKFEWPLFVSPRVAILYCHEYGFSSHAIISHVTSNRFYDNSLQKLKQLPVNFHRHNCELFQINFLHTSYLPDQ
jgi:hypothetical protein